MRPDRAIMSLYFELKHRNVFRVATLYLVFGWLALQVVDVLFGRLGLAHVWSWVALGGFVIGLPVALAIAWTYEMTPEGLKRESEVPPEESIRRHTARRLDFATAVIVIVATAFLIANRYLLKQPPGETHPHPEQPSLKLPAD
jgi:hypothetical protein